jgi:putative aldouronate transport system substrate-binding protein
MPAYVAFQGPAPDFPPTADGVWAGYLTWPKNLVKTVAQPPGKGGDVTFMNATYYQPPTPMEQNAGWQAVNKALNVNLKVITILNRDYPAKLSTTIASGDLPDIFSLGSAGVPNQADFLAAGCADLTPYLSGDAVKEYPNLATLPPEAWLGTVFNGRIYGVNQYLGNLGNVMFVKQNVLDAMGVTEIKSTDDFMRVAKAATIPGNRWFVGSGVSSLPVMTPVGFFAQVFGAPNDWAESGGKLTKDYETDAYKEAVAYTRSLWDAGVMYPDLPSITGPQAAAAFRSEKMVTLWVGLSGVFNYWDTALDIDPDFREDVIPPFSHDGRGKGRHYLTNNNNLWVLKNASPERIRELLGVINYLGAPFGSEEYLLRNWGAKDVDWVFNDKGNPVPTKQGVADMTIPWTLGTASLPPAGTTGVIFNSTYPDHTRAAYEMQKKIMPLGVKNPVEGLYSPTSGQKATVLLKQVTDRISDIVYGRESMSAYDQIVQDWRRNGGDQIRREYEEALQQSRA